MMEIKTKTGLVIMILGTLLNIANAVYFMNKIIYLGSAFVVAFGLILMFPRPKEEVVKNEE